MAQEPSKFGGGARPAENGPYDASAYAAGETVLIFNGLSMEQRLTRVAVMRPLGKSNFTD